MTHLNVPTAEKPAGADVSVACNIRRTRLPGRSVRLQPLHLAPPLCGAGTEPLHPSALVVLAAPVLACIQIIGTVRDPIATATATATMPPHYTTLHHPPPLQPSQVTPYSGERMPTLPLTPHAGDPLHRRDHGPFRCRRHLAPVRLRNAQVHAAQRLGTRHPRHHDGTGRCQVALSHRRQVASLHRRQVAVSHRLTAR